MEGVISVRGPIETTVVKDLGVVTKLLQSHLHIVANASTRNVIWMAETVFNFSLASIPNITYSGNVRIRIYCRSTMD